MRGARTLFSAFGMLKNQWVFDTSIFEGGKVAISSTRFAHFLFEVKNRHLPFTFQAAQKMSKPRESEIDFFSKRKFTP